MKSTAVKSTAVKSTAAKAASSGGISWRENRKRGDRKQCNHGFPQHLLNSHSRIVVQGMTLLEPNCCSGSTLKSGFNVDEQLPKRSSVVFVPFAPSINSKCGWLVWLARSQAMRAPLHALDAGDGTLLFRAG